MNKKKLSKVILLGDSGVGKTSILCSYVDQKFIQRHKVTIGADYLEKQVLVDGKTIILQLWDTAGQQRFRSLGNAFYRGTNCCVLVYDITNKKSFQTIQSWMNQFLIQGSPQQPEKFPFILLGNKIDKQSQREVCQNQIAVFLNKYPLIKHLTVSAKNRQNIEDAFKAIAIASIENNKQEIYIPPVKIGGLTNKKTRCC